MFQRILVPLDGSAASSHALDQALGIANRERSVVTALYTIDARVLGEARVYLPMRDEMRVSDETVPPSKAMRTYQAWAQQVTSCARTRGEEAGVQVRTEIVTGVPYQEIISRSSQFDLLAIGTWDTSRSYPGALPCRQHATTRRRRHSSANTLLTGPGARDPENPGVVRRHS